MHTDGYLLSGYTSYLYNHAEGENKMSDITVEDLQKQLIEQQEVLKQLKAQNEDLNKDLTKTKESLEQSREINNKLWMSGVSDNNNPFPGDSMGNEQDTEETVDQFIDSFVEPAVNRMKKILGDANVGYNH